MSISGNKNILFFQNSILPANGGVPRVSDIISKELIRRGYKCYFVFYDKDNNLYASDCKLKVDFKGNYQKLEMDIMRFAKEKQIDVFLCQNTYYNPFIKVFKQLRKVYPFKPFLCFLHASPDYWQFSFKEKIDFSSGSFLKNAIKKIAKKIVFIFRNPYLKTTTALYDLCDKFILLSDSFHESFLEIYQKEKKDNKLLTIPNPLTFDKYLLMEEISAKQKIVLIISRLEESQKKILSALRVWKLLPKSTRNSWKLMIVGSGPDEAAYKNYAKEHNLHDVCFTGQQVDVIKYYQQSSIFLMTSIWEGLPMSLLEAQQNGVVPVVFDNFSSVYDVVSDGDSGYIIKQNNVMEFRDKLCELMENEGLRRQMALNSIKSSKGYHVSNIVDQWERLLSSKYADVKAINPIAK
ncbi:glycosyltransferase [Mucilaginibacter glaciei]|uniref:Glycosyltransferase n=1 Tax=Mucilaginibacter glaciei TaxID=2772109 RepID=A0A926S214_9SPHI|nr:glycosyltransferase [Mucilaginibacter glaciei]MBD1394645.1 glycosyltransferase [Mucilaginibacter glaciei]